MLYQKILTSERPYIMTVGRLSGFDEHRHADLEFNFCLDGGFDIVIEKERYRVGAGEMTFIGPMASHEIPSSDENRLVITVVVGSSFLKKFFLHQYMFLEQCKHLTNLFQKSFPLLSH